MLHFVDDSSPGITRKRQGRYWKYFDAKGKRITDREEIDRLNGVGMPPAYERVWFCPDPNGHIQATGYDARGRKQYRYHPDFRAHKDSEKYERLAAFGGKLTKIRKKVEEDIAGRAISADTVVAAVVRLIDTTHMRIGNEEYAKENKSFGATTLRKQHAKVAGGKLKLSYAGKHGIKQTCVVNDRNLARIAKRTQDLPGQHLFECLDDEGNARPVTSNDVNDYIRDAAGEDFSAKDFRTWGASVIAFEAMIKKAQEKDRINLKSVIEPVAKALGNTPAISRKSYVHPALIEAAKDAGAVGKRALPRPGKFMNAYERGLVDFLKALPKEKAKTEVKIRAKAKAEGKSKQAAEREVAKEAQAGLKAKAA